MQQLTCANCGNIYTVHFCNQCGQQQMHRYTVKHVLHEILHVFTHADKGIFSFALQVISKPGIIALNLVQGRRKRYFNLFQYLVIIVGIATYVIAKTHLLEQTVNSVNNLTGFKVTAKMATMQQRMVNTMQQYFNLLQFFLIPVYALFSWLFLRRKGFNYAEHVVLNSVISAQMNTLSVANILLFSLIQTQKSLPLYGLVALILLIVCFVISFRQFFQISYTKALLYTLGVYICAYVVQLITISLALFFYVMITK